MTRAYEGVFPLQALNLFREKTGTSQHMRIKLDKQVPTGETYLATSAFCHLGRKGVGVGAFSNRTPSFRFTSVSRMCQ